MNIIDEKGDPIGPEMDYQYRGKIGHEYIKSVRKGLNTAMGISIAILLLGFFVLYNADTFKVTNAEGAQIISGICFLIGFLRLFSIWITYKNRKKLDFILTPEFISAESESKLPDAIIENTK